MVKALDSSSRFLPRVKDMQHFLEVQDMPNIFAIWSQTAECGTCTPEFNNRTIG